MAKKEDKVTTDHYTSPPEGTSENSDLEPNDLQREAAAPVAIEVETVDSRLAYYEAAFAKAEAKTPEAIRLAAAIDELLWVKSIS